MRVSVVELQVSIRMRQALNKLHFLKNKYAATIM